MTATRQLFESRRAFGRGYARFDAWFGAQKSPISEAIWHRFASEVLTSFVAQSAAIWSCGVHPQQRARLTWLLCEAARAKMELDGFGGDHQFDPHEGQIWDAALCVSRRAVENWEAQVWRERGEFGGIYRGAAHRLADLYRRADRADERALRLYGAVFVGPNAAPTARVGAGSHISVDALLQRGAAISAATAPDTIGARYNLCLLLQMRGYRAQWLGPSLDLARAHSPRTGEMLQRRLGLTAARDFKATQAPAIAQLISQLEQLAQIRAEQMRAEKAAATSRAELKRQKAQAQAQIERELQELARANAEAKAKAKKPKAKRKRKAAPNDTPVALPSKAVSKEQLEFDRLFDEAFADEAPKAAPNSKQKPAPVDDWDDFLAEFEADIG